MSRLPLLVLALSFIVLPLAVFAFTKKRAEESAPAPVASTEAVPAPAGGDTTWVRKSDGGIQCEPDKSTALDAAAKDLEGGGVKVLEKKKTRDGKIRPQMCGMAAGTENSFRIARGDLTKASALGYRE